MSILCVGRSGQVAKALAERAEAQNVNCICMGRPELDLLDSESIRAAIERTKPTFVVNAAAYTSVDGAESDRASAFALNTEAPGFLAEFCAEFDIPLLHISTDYVFDGTSASPYSEDDPTGPISVYGKTKYEGEVRVKEATRKHIILRTSWVYGPHNPNFVTTMLRLAKERGGASVVDDQIGAPTSALDIADAILTISECVADKSNPDYWGTFHFTAKDHCSWADFADAIFKQFDARTNSSTSLKRIPTSEYPTPAKRPMNSRLATEKVTKVFGIQPNEWKLGVTESVSRILA